MTAGGAGLTGVPSDVRSLARDRGNVAYVRRGAGPPLLVPYCNLPWLQLPVAGALTRQFDVLFVAPRGYALSSRLGPAEAYSATMLLDDLLAVCDAVRFRRFSVLGYSLTAAVAAWLGTLSGRVDAVVAGGFPLLADYGVMLDDVQARTDAAGEGSAIDLGFDVRAAAAFYDDLARLPAAGLVDALRCPIFVFWGSDDEVLEQFEGRAHLEAGLAGRGIEHRVLAGTDHAATAFGLERVLPDVVEWLARVIPPDQT